MNRFIFVFLLALLASSASAATWGTKAFAFHGRITVNQGAWSRNGAVLRVLHELARRIDNNGVFVSAEARVMGQAQKDAMAAGRLAGSAAGGYGRPDGGGQQGVMAGPMDLLPADGCIGQPLKAPSTQEAQEGWGGRIFFTGSRVD